MRDSEDDRRPVRPVAHEVGADLAAISVEELAHRVALLESEIIRLRQEIGRKEASKAAASSFFKS